eukprot:COSAG01_NODE_1135_length_11553_cov_40.402305_11_plen_227_part_00
MKKLLLMLCVLMSFSGVYAANEYNVRIGYGLESDAGTFKSGELKDTVKLRNAIMFSGSYLYDFNLSNKYVSSVKVGPFLRYQLPTDVKVDGLSGVKASFISFGVDSKAYFTDKLYVFGSLGYNMVKESGIKNSIVDNSMKLLGDLSSVPEAQIQAIRTTLSNSISVDTSNGVVFVIGSGFHVTDEISLEASLMKKTGGIDILVTNSDNSTGDLDQTSVSLALNYIF